MLELVLWIIYEMIYCNDVLDCNTPPGAACYQRAEGAPGLTGEAAGMDKTWE